MWMVGFGHPRTVKIKRDFHGKGVIIKWLKTIPPGKGGLELI